MIFTYTISTETLNGAVATAKLTDEIRNEATITIALETVAVDGDTLTIEFRDNLTTPQETALDAVVAAHDGNPGLNDARKGQIVGEDQVTPVSIIDDGGIKRLAIDVKQDTTNIFEKSEFISESTGVADADKPIKTDAGGQIDGSLVNEANDIFTIKNVANSLFNILIDAGSAISSLGASISKAGTSGFLHFMPNAETSQIIFSDPNSATGVNKLFLDVDNGGDMYIQTLPGAGASGELILSDGAPTRPDNDLTSDLGRTDKRWKDVYAGTFYGDGSNLTGIAVSGINTFDATAFGAIADRALVQFRGTNTVQEQSNDLLPPIGFAVGAISSGATGTIQYEDVLGGFTGLTAGLVYYADNSTSGAITSTIPTTGPIYMVGVAKSTTEIQISFRNMSRMKNNALSVGNIGSASNAANQNFQIDLSAYGFSIGETVRLGNSLVRGDLSSDGTEYIDVGFNSTGDPKARLGDTGYDDLSIFRTDGGLVDRTYTVVDIGSGVPGLEVYVSPASAVNFSPSGMPNGWWWQFKINVLVV